MTLPRTRTPVIARVVWCFALPLREKLPQDASHWWAFEERAHR